jgi:DNA/RNA-binding domain of Phe-tRNA-synthetase-like protein
LISIELPGVKLGLVEAGDVRVELVREDLASEMDSMFRAWGVDPSKYRPSSEALLRRVSQGKGLYRVNNIVDALNLSSIESGWPYGLYDRAHFSAPVVFRHGHAGEMYEGIGRRMWHLEGRPVLADPQGAFGSPISDSTRTMITESSRSVLAVLFAPMQSSEQELIRAAEIQARRFEQFCSARLTRTSVILP